MAGTVSIKQSLCPLQYSAMEHVREVGSSRMASGTARSFVISSGWERDFGLGKGWCHGVVRSRTTSCLKQLQDPERRWLCALSPFCAGIRSSVCPIQHVLAMCRYRFRSECALGGRCEVGLTRRKENDALCGYRRTEGLQKCQGRVGSNQRENQGCEETREADNKDDVEGQAVEEEEEEEEEEENEREVSTERGDQREDGGGRPECAQTRKGEEGLGKDEGGRGGEEERIRGREERAEEIDGGRKEVLVMDGDREELKGGPLRASGSRKEVEKGGGVEEKDLGRVKGGGEKKKNRKQYEAIGKLPNLFEGALAIAAAEKAGFPLDEKKIHPLLRSREAREKLIAISQRTRESTGLHMEEGPVSLGSEKDGWCALCGVRSGWMMCGRCDGQGVYPSLRGLAGVSEKVGNVRCKSCYGRGIVPCLLCGIPDPAKWRAWQEFAKRHPRKLSDKYGISDDTDLESS